jgi:DNA helicase-2/ATP-dependent DNA helicase PcrA
MLPQRYRYAVHSQHEHFEERAVPTESFAAGDHVRHSKFGEGIVVSCEPSGNDYQVVVAFRGEAGIKKLLLSFAPLEKLQATG